MAGLPTSFRAVHYFPLEKRVTWICSKDNYCLRIDESSFTENGAGIEAGEGCFLNFTDLFQCQNVYAAFQDTEEREWILTDNGTFILSDGLSHLPEEYTTFVKTDRHIWLATSDGQLDCYDVPTLAKTPFQSEELQKRLPSPAISALVDMEQSPEKDFEMAVIHPESIVMLNDDGKTRHSSH